MSTSYIAWLTTISQQITIYLGMFILIAGFFGGILNIIVFLSLKTFRQSSCAFYLTAMSFANIFHLIFSFIPHILMNGYGIDWSASSIIYCKFRFYVVQLWLLTSFTCMCLATMDQFLATCFNPYWHRWNNIKLARYILGGFFLVWLLHGIPFSVYYNVNMSPINPNQSTCSITNVIFQGYNTFGYVFIFRGILPLIIMVLFGLLAHYNVRNLVYRTVPLIRRELDKQITQMVLVQVIYNIFVLIPFVIVTLVIFIVSTNDQTNFARTFAITIQNLYFASPFYIYICVSKRFRQQFNHVLCHIHLNQWRQPNIINNQVVPQLTDGLNNNF